MYYSEFPYLKVFEKGELFVSQIRKFYFYVVVELTIADLFLSAQNLVENGLFEGIANSSLLRNCLLQLPLYFFQLLLIIFFQIVHPSVTVP